METESKQCEIEQLRTQIENLTNEVQHLRSMHPLDGETSFSSQGQSELTVLIKDLSCAEVEEKMSFAYQIITFN